MTRRAFSVYRSNIEPLQEPVGMFPPIELCYLPPLSPALNKNGDRTIRTLLAQALHLLQTRPPRAGCNYTSSDCGDTSTARPRSSRRTRSHRRANPRLCVTMSEVRR